MSEKKQIKTDNLIKHIIAGIKSGSLYCNNVPENYAFESSIIETERKAGIRLNEIFA